jgi:hypothetical protein
MPFERCAECRLCCHVEEGYPPLEVTLTANEKKKFGSLCIETNCENLSSTGCTLGDDKPFSCKLYPLSYNPVRKRFYFDKDCPLMPEYIAQLSNPKSVASLHLSEVRGTIKVLEERDPGFLKTNHAVDVDYFNLEKLPLPILNKDEPA